MFSPGKFVVPAFISEPPPTGFEKKANVVQKVPNDKGNKILSRTAGATGPKNSTVTKLAFGGTRRKGRKLSKQRRLTRLRVRQPPKKAQTSH
jgi:hypothetical protein